MPPAEAAGSGRVARGRGPAAAAAGQSRRRGRAADRVRTARPPFGKRAAGSLTSICMTELRDRRRHVRAAAARGASRTCAIAIATAFSPVNGSAPGQAFVGDDSRARRCRTPARPPGPAACSGEMYCAVPITMPGAGDRHLVGHLGDAEVGDLDLAARGDQQVARLDVPVHQRPGVRDLQRPAGLVEHVEGAAGADSRPVRARTADSGSPAISSITR